MEIRVNEEDHLTLLYELKELRKQRDDLQKDNTKLELENRDLRRIVRRLDKFPEPTVRELRWLESLGDDNDKMEFANDELRRSAFWMRLRGVFGVYE